MSIGKLKNVDFSLESLKNFAKVRFGSLKNMAQAMGISQPQLSAYTSGKREFGASMRDRLEDIGFFAFISNSDKIPNELDKRCLINEVKQSERVGQTADVGKTFEGLDINGAIDLANTPASRLATLVGVPAATLAAWQNGTEKPTTEQLANLFNLVVALGLSARTTTSDKTEQPPAQATG